MNILLNKILTVSFILQTFILMPAYALDLDSTVNDKSRTNYTREKSTNQTTTNSINSSKQLQNVNNTQISPQTPVTTEIMEKAILPAVPALPEKANSSTIAPINTQYSGRCPNAEAIIPCSNIVVGDLIIDESVLKAKPATIASKKNKNVAYQPSKKTTSKVNYRYVKLSKGTQMRAVNTSKINDYMFPGQTITFLTTHEICTPYLKIPAKTQLTARVVSSHGPQMSCNGGLVAFKIVSAKINGYTQPLDAGIVKINNKNVQFSNLKGEHTYKKTLCKKAKWGQTKFSKWSKTASKLASDGPLIIISPFPYLGGCVAACASTLSSPVTALLGKGGSLSIPANTVFTIKLYDDAKIRY